MDTYDTERIRIEKLTGAANYWPWSVQVKKTLIGKDLWEVVENGVYTPNEGSKEVAPKEMAPVHAELRTVQRCARASVIIMEASIPTVRSNILLKETAKEQWDTYKQMYGSTNLDQLAVKQEAFVTYKPQKGAKVSDIVTRFDTLQYEIMSIDPKETLTEKSKILQLILAVTDLDARYEPLILQLKIAKKESDYALVVDHLLEFERKLDRIDSAKETGLRADTEQKESKSQQSKSKFKGKCYYCQKEGHRKAECKKRINDEKSEKGGPSTGPLATPSGGKGLSPPPEQAKVASEGASEVCWLG
jgi:LysM repeat protein